MLALLSTGMTKGVPVPWPKGPMVRWLVTNLSEVTTSVKSPIGPSEPCTSFTYSDGPKVI
uniref:Uncharacterized protein n=1 Tax=Oryza brachyantha TaxID=4533 RepID=J3LPK2_ORYBR